MKVYIFTIFCLIAFLYSLYHLVSPRRMPPEKYSETFKSKGKVANFIYEKVGEKLLSRETPPNIFHEIAAWIHFFVFSISIAICIADICTNFYISTLIGRRVLLILSAAVIGLPFFYELFIFIFWHYLDD